MKRTTVLLAIALIVNVIASCQQKVKDPALDSSDFVSVTDVIPDAVLEIRYYSTYNFVGTRVDGYLSPIAMLTKEAADSLKVVNDELRNLGYVIKIFDAYRPQQAVDHFVRWAADLDDTKMKPYFYPNVDKTLLFEQKYIMSQSGHSRGSTVDLTILDMKTGKELDMASQFDWFGHESSPYFGGNPETLEYIPGENITPEQFYNRMFLRSVMVKHGFTTLESEWWHFTLENEPYPDTYFNFPVKQ